MFWHTITKHIRCIPCDRRIEVRRFRTTAESKELQDRYIEGMINARQLLGFPMCPRCKKKATISDAPIALFDKDGNAHRDAKGKIISKYPDQLDMSQVKMDRYGHARTSYRRKGARPHGDAERRT